MVLGMVFSFQGVIYTTKLNKYMIEFLIKRLNRTRFKSRNMSGS